VAGEKDHLAPRLGRGIPTGIGPAGADMPTMAGRQVFSCRAIACSPPTPHGTALDNCYFDARVHILVDIPAQDIYQAWSGRPGHGGVAAARPFRRATAGDGQTDRILHTKDSNRVLA
jgi:hypothetical protein